MLTWLGRSAFLRPPCASGSGTFSTLGSCRSWASQTPSAWVSRQAMIGLRVDGDLRAVADRLAAVPEVDYVVICAGSFDLLAGVVCEDDQALLRLLNEAIRVIPGVRSTETFLYLELAKQTYTWGTR
jgi:DNA-binding Lrp family transcriptional regulator